MSNAEQAWKVEAERKRWGKLPTTTYNPVHEAFHLGYARGRADAMELPEVRADELVDGEWYVAVMNDGKECIGKAYDHDLLAIVSDFEARWVIGGRRVTSFRGPLPLGGGE